RAEGARRARGSGAALAGRSPAGRPSAGWSPAPRLRARWSSRDRAREILATAILATAILATGLLASEHLVREGKLVRVGPTGERRVRRRPEHASPERASLAVPRPAGVQAHSGPPGRAPDAAAPRVGGRAAVAWGVPGWAAAGWVAARLAGPAGARRVRPAGTGRQEAA